MVKLKRKVRGQRERGDVSEKKPLGEQIIRSAGDDTYQDPLRLRPRTAESGSISARRCAHILRRGTGGGKVEKTALEVFRIQKVCTVEGGVWRELVWEGGAARSGKGTKFKKNELGRGGSKSNSLLSPIA